MGLHIRKIRLLKNDAYIAWTVFSSGLLDKLDLMPLNEKEKKRLNTFKNNQRKNEFITTRVLLNSIELGALIRYEKNGKPLLENSTKGISISHSKNVAAIIVSNSLETAIDVQVFNDKVLSLRSKFLSPKELKMIDKSDVEKNSLAWSVKETLFKSINQENVPYKTCLNIADISENTVKCKISHNNINKNVTVQYKVFDTFVMTYFA